MNSNKNFVKVASVRSTDTTCICALYENGRIISLHSNTINIKDNTIKKYKLNELWKH